jgi:hypothetical protein
MRAARLKQDSRTVSGDVKKDEEDAEGKKKRQ